MRNGAEECHEKSPSGHPEPYTVPANQNRSERDAVRRPYRPKITAPDVRGSLAEFARDQIGDQDNRNLEQVPSADALLESLTLNLLNHVAFYTLVLHPKCQSH